ncbi:MAG: type IV secretion system protein [Erythrobacter sp.]
MTTRCDTAVEDMGAGVAAALKAVDCIAANVSEQAFNRLFGSEGQLAFALTLMLVLYVSFFALSLMLGRSNLSVRALLPKMITLGLVLTFATSFVAYQSFFYNVVIGAPNEVAGILTGSRGSATDTFAQKLDVVFLALQQTGGETQDINAFSPQGMMWLGAMLLLLGTVGLLVTARIGLALLLAIGPIFVVLALFEGTRGLFVGWLKGLVMLAIAPLLAVLGGSIMLELAVPILAQLVAVPGVIDQQAAMAFFLVGAVHIALMFMALRVASTMVAGWQVFGFARQDAVSAGGNAMRAPSAAVANAATVNAALAAARAPAAPMAALRRLDVAPAATTLAANDASGSTGGTIRETRVYATSSGGGQASPLAPGASRTRGIGNRFRSASKAPTAPVAAPMAANAKPVETYQ